MNDKLQKDNFQSCNIISKSILKLNIDPLMQEYPKFYDLISKDFILIPPPLIYKGKKLRKKCYGIVLSSFLVREGILKVKWKKSSDYFSVYTLKDSKFQVLEGLEKVMDINYLLEDLFSVFNEDGYQKIIEIVNQTISLTLNFRKLIISKPNILFKGDQGMIVSGMTQKFNNSKILILYQKQKYLKIIKSINLNDKIERKSKVKKKPLKQSQFFQITKKIFENLFFLKFTNKINKLNHPEDSMIERGYIVSIKDNINDNDENKSKVNFLQVFNIKKLEGFHDDRITILAKKDSLTSQDSLILNNYPFIKIKITLKTK